MLVINVPLQVIINPQVAAGVGFNIGVAGIGTVGNQTVTQTTGNESNAGQVSLFAFDD